VLAAEPMPCRSPAAAPSISGWVVTYDMCFADCSLIGDGLPVPRARSVPHRICCQKSRGAHSGAVLQTEGLKVTNSKEVVTFVFVAAADLVASESTLRGFDRPRPPRGPVRLCCSWWSLTALTRFPQGAPRAPIVICARNPMPTRLRLPRSSGTRASSSHAGFQRADQSIQE
jgi:hypothetical protein